MNEYYSEEFYLSAQKQRKKSLIIFFSITAFYLLVFAGMLTWYLTLPYNSPKITTVKLILYPITGIFVIFAFLYLGIIHKRIKKYYALTKRLKTGIRETSVAEFLRFDDTLQQKDGVDMKSLIFKEWNKYKKEFYERKVLVFYEKDFPKMESGEKIKFITVGNVLISYETEKE